jgi:Cyclic nucleotide-binding domain
VTRLADRLGIEAVEAQVFACSAAILFLVGWADVQITNVAETLFLKRVGVEYLPIVFLANSILLVGTTFVVGRIAARADQVRVFTWTLTLLALTLLPLWLLVLAGWSSVFWLLLMASKQLDSIALLVFWIALGGLLHGRQAKRLYAPMTAGATLGTILGSFASGPLGRTLGIAALLPAASVSLLVAALLSAPLRRLAPTRLDATARAARPPAPPREGAEPTLPSLWRESLLVRVLVTGAFLSGVLGPMLYFQFSYVADLATVGANPEQRLLDLYAQFRGWINLGVLGLQLAGTSRLYRRIGVPLAAALSPLAYLVGFLGLSVQLGLRAGIGAVAATTLEDHAVYDPAQRVLVTLFNERVRAVVTALIDGPVKRAGTAVGSLAVLVVLALASPPWVGYVAVPIAAIWLAVSVVLWRAYPSLLLDTLSTRPAQTRDELPLAELIDPATLRLLESSLSDPDRERCRAACALVGEGRPERALAVLARAARRAPAANRDLVVATLVRLLRQHPDLRSAPPEAGRALAALLAEAGTLPEIDRARIARAYGHLAAPATDTAARALLERLADDPAASVRVAATAALLHAGAAPPSTGDLDAVLGEAIGSADAGVREVARDELRALLLAADSAATADDRRRQWLALLVSGLTRPEDRADTAEALADLAAARGAAVAEGAEPLLAHGDDPDPCVRAAVLRFVGHARLAEHAAWLVEHVGARDEREAAAAREALRVLGPAIMDVLLQTLHLGKRSTRLALLPIVREMPIGTRTLHGLIDGELDGARRTLLQLHALQQGRISDLVLQRLHERIAEASYTVLVLLAALLHDDRIARLGRLLSRTAAGGRERAVLLEALEALLPADERPRIMPLLEEEDTRGSAAAAARWLHAPIPSFGEALRDALAGEDALTRAFLAATLDEALVARYLAPPDGTVPGGSRQPGVSARDGRDSRERAKGTPPDARKTMALSRVEIVLHLRSLDLFVRLTTRQLTDLGGVVREETYAPGTTIVREGEFDDCMYLIVGGQVRITKEGRLLAELGPRSFFGEMAVFDGATRSATATATSALHVLRLERLDLFQVMEEQPGIAIAICQTLSRRVRDLNERVQVTKHD